MDTNNATDVNNTEDLHWKWYVLFGIGGFLVGMAPLALLAAVVYFGT